MGDKIYGDMWGEALYNKELLNEPRIIIYGASTKEAGKQILVVPNILAAKNVVSFLEKIIKEHEKNNFSLRKSRKGKV